MESQRHVNVSSFSVDTGEGQVEAGGMTVRVLRALPNGDRDNNSIQLLFANHPELIPVTKQLLDMIRSIIERDFR